MDRKVPRRKKSILEAAKSRLKNKKYYLINKKERKTLFKTEWLLEVEFLWNINRNQ